MLEWVANRRSGFLVDRGNNSGAPVDSGLRLADEAAQLPVDPNQRLPLHLVGEVAPASVRPPVSRFHRERLSIQSPCPGSLVHLAGVRYRGANEVGCTPGVVVAEMRATFPVDPSHRAPAGCALGTLSLPSETESLNANA